jgi:hypothetical protein
MHALITGRSLIVLLGLLVLFAAACSSSDSEGAEDIPTATPTEAGVSDEADAESADSADPADSLDPAELPTTDPEIALQGIDTESAPPDGYCEISGYLNSAEMSAEYEVAVTGGPGSDEAIAGINLRFADLERLAPEGLADDAAAVGAVINQYLTEVSTAVEEDDFVDVTQLEEDFQAVADSGGRLNAYDEVVCGNAAPGSSGT